MLIFTVHAIWSSERLSIKWKFTIVENYSRTLLNLLIQLMFGYSMIFFHNSGNHVIMVIINERKPKEKARMEKLETMATMGTGRRHKQSEIMILLINGYAISSFKKSRLSASSCRLQFKHVYIPPACHISLKTSVN